MKLELIHEFPEKFGGAENCIVMLKSEVALIIALGFVRLVRSTYSQEECTLAELDLSKSPEYQVLLIEAINAGAYEQVERHILNALNPPQELADIKRSVTEPSLFAGAFKTQYIGTAAAVLYQHLGQLQWEFYSHPGRYYAKICTIVQSSGTGKSRALIELKNEGAIVVYLNLRSKMESGDPCPDRDEIPAHILTANLNCTEQEYSRRCGAFLTALLRVLKIYLLVEFRKEGGTREDIIKAWSRSMCDMTSDSRRRFFSDVRTEYEPVKLSNDFFTLSKDPKPDSTAPGSRGGTALNRAYTDLIWALPEIFNLESNSPSLIVAVDEAHPLCERQKHFVPSHVLSRAISELSQNHTQVSFWFVFASTTFKLADFSAPADLCSSSRVSIGGETVFPPYYDFGWDQHALALTAVEPEKVGLFSHIVRFGRPLWYSLAESNMPPRQVLEIAGQRPCGQLKLNLGDLHQALAVVGQRFRLDIRCGSHFIKSGFQVTFGCASGLAKAVNCWKPHIPQNPYPTSGDFFATIGGAFGQLKAAVLDGTIHKGLEGELVSRLIFLMGKDVAIRTLHGTPASEASTTPGLDTSSMSGELLDCQPLPVVEYLTVLFGENALDQEARHIFDGWHVNFSHWIGMDQNIKFDDSSDDSSDDSETEFGPVTEMTEWLLCNWTRTSAVQCCRGQPSFSKVIPMYKLRKPSEPRSEDNPDASRISFILISDRNKAATTSAVGNISPQHAYLPTLGQPYIAILADFGAAEEGTRIKRRKSVLRIHALGSGPRTYPFLTGTMADVVRDILRIRNLEDDISASRSHLKQLVRFGHSAEEAVRISGLGSNRTNS
ncbi:hypothetical protein FRC10_006809 [Ceratobasidium sp. 414]|nr:hypothetical protein FRC10_006809 [Ceratobasidium sp. 414]